MIDSILSLMKDDNRMSNYSLYFLGLIITLLILKSLLKSKKINPKIFDNIALIISVPFCILFFGNVYFNEKYIRLSYVLVAILGAILQKKIPKFIKWYDDKVDKMMEKN